MRTTDLRTAVLPVRLWCEAPPRLGVYGWFTEGFDTLDLKEAKSLLDTRRYEALV